MTMRNTVVAVPARVSIRLDDESARALRLLAAAGLTRSGAIRGAILEAADRVRRIDSLRADVAALEADEADRAEQAEVAALMEAVVASAEECLHTESMANLLVRDVPEAVHAELQRRAVRHGQSLQQYLTDELRRLTDRPELDEVLDRIERRRGGHVGLARAAQDVAEDRERR
jgi:plasmid stability protein